MKYQLVGRDGEVVHSGEESALGHVFIVIKTTWDARREFVASAVLYPDGFDMEHGDPSGIEVVYREMVPVPGLRREYAGVWQEPAPPPGKP